jgi:hypothetical protein
LLDPLVPLGMTKRLGIGRDATRSRLMAFEEKWRVSDPSDLFNASIQRLLGVARRVVPRCRVRTCGIGATVGDVFRDDNSERI